MGITQRAEAGQGMDCDGGRGKILHASSIQLDTQGKSRFEPNPPQCLNHSSIGLWASSIQGYLQQGTSNLCTPYHTPLP